MPICLLGKEVGLTNTFITLTLMLTHNMAYCTIRFSAYVDSLVPHMDFGKLNKKATNLVGGDMVPSKGKNVPMGTTKWPNAQIPYVISVDYSKLIVYTNY